MPMPNELDRDEILELLEQRENPPAAEKFADALHTWLCLDRALIMYGSKSYTRTDKVQYEILLKIQNCPKRTLEVFEVLGNGKLVASTENVDIGTISLIKTTLMIINSERMRNLVKTTSSNDVVWSKAHGKTDLSMNAEINRAVEDLENAFRKIGVSHGEKSLASGKIGPEILGDESIPLVSSIEELSYAISVAASKVKPKRGPGIKNSEKLIRKNILADRFVQSYRMHFKEFAPISRDGDVCVLFNKFLLAANVSDDDEESCYVNAVLRDKAIYKNFSLLKLKSTRPKRYKNRIAKKS